MRVVKWISLVLAGLLVLLLLAVAVLVWFVDPNAYKPRIEAAVKEATGRDFALAGDIELDVFPWLALRAGAGHFGNAQGFGPEPMVRWKGAQVGAKLFPLLRGELVASRVRFEGADVRLVRRADGHANWEGIGDGKPKDPDAEPWKLRIDGVELADSRLSFVDETVPRTIRVEALNFTTEEIAEGEPFEDTELRGIVHMDGFAAAGVPVRLEVPRADVAWDLSKIAVAEYSLTIGGLTLEGSAGGGIAGEPNLSGAVESNEFDPRELLASVGIDPPKTTDPQALSTVKLATKWTFAAGAVALEALALAVDETRFTGSFSRGAGEHAVGEIAMRGDSIDLARYIPPSDPASEPFVLPTALLKDLKFRGTFELERATLGDVEMNGVTLRLVLDELGLRSESAGRRNDAWLHDRAAAPRLARARRAPRPALAARAQRLSRLGIGGDAAADAGEHGDPVLRALRAALPDVRALADAPDDEVMHLWTGLGYYARARNLLRAARVVRDVHGGRFPDTLDVVLELPGIGRSTAGAILAMSANQRHAILDGNVKRVLARYYAIDGAAGEAATLAQLWRRAEENTPAEDVAVYTQAIMDLGATVCTRARPRCTECPLTADCRARLENRQDALPAAKRRRADRRRRHAVMLVARSAAKVLLVQRPQSGIWGGLWCLPEFADRDAAAAFAQRELARAELERQSLPDIEHSFTHFDLVITPVIVRCEPAPRVRESGSLWYDLTAPARVGLPAPIRTLLGSLKENGVT